ncbi:flagellar biosynthetic protein FliR [Vampirovibrio sp.]|uniref:flagellar biosynthetic protein FliR n=1 Tax=Vampirovibrio sp. TaxID=2717857 RepID=UPI0035939E13
MHFDPAMESFALMYKQLGPVADGVLLMFFRMLAFATTGPIFNRKNIPILIKISAAVFFTGALAWMVPPDPIGPLSPAGQYPPYLIQLLLNIVVGALLGFIADMILQAAYAAGNIMNNQIGLSSAMIMDPSSGKQAMLLETLFNNITILLFIDLGGVHWMLSALKRSFDVFPLYAMQQPLVQTISLDYLILVSGNILLIGVQLVSPVMVVTMAVDLMLGIMNRTAQQMPVFQLSFALKPSIGIAVMIMTLTTFLQALSNYLNEYAKIF